MIHIDNLSFSYKKNKALEGISLSIDQGEVFGLLGPNGSGKTTLFRILSTMLEYEMGNVTIDEIDLKKFPSEIRKKIGVVFQSPSLDGKLTVKENIVYQSALYGLKAKETQARMEKLLNRLNLNDRLHEKTEKLSGGLKRRVELAKTLLHKPKILILDEPSTGLDPAARFDFWQYVNEIVREEGITVLVTTHLMDEAEKCDRLAILDHGKMICLGTPEELKNKVGKDVVMIKAKSDVEATRRVASTLEERIKQKFNLDSIILDGFLQIEHERAAEIVPKLVEAFPGEITSVTYRKPTLEDVFMHHTGHSFYLAKERSL